MDQAAIKFSSNSSIELMQYVNTRARITRLTDGKVYSAWVAPSFGDKLLLSVGEINLLTEGEKFHVVLSSSTGSLDFESVFEIMQGQRAVFSLPNQVELKAPIERMRRRVLNTSGLASINGLDFPIKVIDVSRNGFGANSPVPVPVGSTIEIKISTVHGIVTLHAKSAHSRFNDEIAMHAVGFELATITYENDLKWLKIVHDVD